MKASLAVEIESRLSDDALALVHQWTVAQGEIDEEALVDVVAAFATVLERNLQTRTSEAAKQVRPHRGRWVMVIDFPPFMELAMREVVDAIRSVGGVGRRLERVRAMTGLLAGRGSGLA